MSQWRFFFILVSSKLTAENIYLKDNFGSDSGSAPALQHWHCIVYNHEHVQYTNVGTFMYTLYMNS